MPVTALAFCQFHRLYLLAGEGKELKIFDYEKKKLLCKEQVFDSKTIHGITCHVNSKDKGHALLLIWGGRSVCIVHIQICENDELNQWIKAIHKSPELRLNDWILDGCFSDINSQTKTTEEDESYALLITAHNELYVLTFDASPDADFKATSVPSLLATGPRSILYSAHVIWPSEGHIIVAAGTVFGEVLFWSCYAREPDEVGSISLHHAFIGHEGSVFGVRISEPVENGKRILASCSDDRTIRVWELEEEIEEKMPSASDTSDTDNLRSTNEAEPFGSVESKNSTEALAKVMGHASRIWGLRFLCQANGSWDFVSYGEDGTAQTWKLSLKTVPSQGRSDRVFELKHVHTFSYHSGKNIWALATLLESSNECVIASGGADGRIVSYKPILRDNCNENNFWSCQNSMAGVLATMSTDTAEKSNTSVNHAHTLTKSLFDSLEGSWRLTRQIDSLESTHPSGLFEGTADFERRPPSDMKYTAEYLYSENGLFKIENGIFMKAKRHYVYRYDKNSDNITVWFVKVDDANVVDYFFHDLNFRRVDSKASEDAHIDSLSELMASGHHLCNEDLYQPEYRFRMKPSGVEDWNILFKVVGPKKNYSTMAHFSRDHPMAVMNSSILATHKDPLNVCHESGREVKVTSAQKPELDAFKTYIWISDDKLLMSTQAGNLLTGTINSKRKDKQQTTVSWKRISHQPLLQSSCLATSIPSLGVAFLTGMDGTIFSYVHERSEIQILHNLSRKSGFLKAQSLSCKWQRRSPETSESNTIGIFAACLGSLEATALILKSGENYLHLAVREIVTLELPTGFVVTSSCFTDGETVIILGSRSGDVAIYVLLDSYPTPSDHLKPQAINQIHGEEAVTVIQLIPAVCENLDTTFVLTAGRDGTYSIHQLSYTTSPSSSIKIDFQTLHTGTPSFGPNIEGACIDNTQLYLWGFRSKDFVVWNESQKQEVMTVNCGGAHRNWAYFHNRDGSGGGKFVYTKASICHLHVQKRSFHQVFQHGGHGREIKAMALSPPTAVHNNTERQTRLLATGAEDTTIRIFQLDNTNQETLKCLAILPTHTTGLQTLHWSSNGHYLFSAAGCEEFFVWRVRKAPLVTIGVVCEAKCPTVTDEVDLRIMDFAVLPLPNTNDHTNEEENECSYLITTIYSDSSLRIFHYTPQQQTKPFTLLAKSTYSTHCLTQINYLHHHHHSTDELHLCTASTDRHLAFWSLPSSIYSSTTTNPPLTLSPPTS